jgi:glycerol-1-phosphate dehydrogenase [NAD(P)+]
MFRDITPLVNSYLDHNNYKEGRLEVLHMGSDLMNRVEGILPQNYLIVCDDNLFSLAKLYFPEDKIHSLGTQITAQIELAELLIANYPSRFFIAFGSGTINDICKYAASRLGINYWLLPTAASMNGFTSNVASIKFYGLSKSIKCSVPQRVYIDLDIIKAAPLRLTLSGIGDVLCRFNCQAEWSLVSKLFKGGYRGDIYRNIEELERAFIENLDLTNISLDKLSQLMELIIFSGLAMSVIGGSECASQSEHAMTHSFDFLYPDLAMKFFHGEKVAFFTTYSYKIWCRLFKEGELGEIDDKAYSKLLLKIKSLRNNKDDKILYQISRKKMILAEEIKKISNIQKKYLKNKTNHVICGLENSEYYSQMKILGIVGAHLERSLSNERIENTINVSPFIRERFTIVDLYMLTGGRAEDLL